MSVVGARDWTAAGVSDEGDVEDFLLWCQARSAPNFRVRSCDRATGSSVLDRRQKASHWTNPAMVFELMEVLVLQGLQTSNVAANCSATGDYVSAAKYLREAAGIDGLERFDAFTPAP